MLSQGLFGGIDILTMFAEFFLRQEPRFKRLSSPLQNSYPNRPVYSPWINGYRMVKCPCYGKDRITNRRRAARPINISH